MATVPTAVIIAVWILRYVTKNGNTREVRFTDKQAGKDYRDTLKARGFEILFWGLATVLLFVFVDRHNPQIMKCYPDWFQQFVPVTDVVSFVDYLSEMMCAA